MSDTHVAEWRRFFNTMPSDRSLNVLDRFQRRYRAATDDENPAVYRAAALAIERLRRVEPPTGAYWIALAERLTHKGYHTGWMLNHADGFHRGIVIECYNAAFDTDDDPITDLQIMAKKQHFENGAVRDGMNPDDHPDDCDCRACARSDGQQDASA